MVLIDAEWTVVLSDDEEVKTLNATYRNKDKVTDVLSFAQNEGEGPLVPLLGDVIISVEQAKRQAPKADVEAEIVRLMVHGFCHLVGLDHQNESDKKTMQLEEDSILSRFGLKSGLISRSDA